MSQHNEQSPIRRILRLRTVRELTSLSRSCIDRLEAEGDFPLRFRLGLRAVGWYEDEVAAWINSRKPAREVCA